MIKIAQSRQTLASLGNGGLVARWELPATSRETRCGLFCLQNTPSLLPIGPKPVFEGQCPECRLARSILPHRCLS